MNNSYQVLTLSPMRQIVIEVLNEGRRWNHVHGLIQIDITETRRRFASIKKKGKEPPSMTGFIVFCLAHALNENKSLQALRRGRRLYIFEDVDVSTVIEREDANGQVAPASLIIRSANKKSLRDIHSEIRTAQTRLLTGSILGEDAQSKRTNLFLRLPPFLRKPIWWWSRMSPNFKKKNMGTVHVSSVGMFADGFDAGWAIPLAPWPLILTVGTISKRACKSASGDIEDHEFINLTLTIDHDVVDGSPATRFLVSFKKMLETGFGIDVP